MWKDILKRYYNRLKWKLRPPTQKDIDEVIAYGENHYPQVRYIDDTISEILEGKSIARMGDGEFMICLGRSIGFQKRNKVLYNRLREVLKNNNPNCVIGILDFDPSVFTDFWRHFWYKNLTEILPLLNKDSVYYYSGLTRSFSIEQVDRLATVWTNKNIIFVSGKGSRFDIEHELFKEIQSSVIVEGNAVNAWENYDELLQNCLSTTKNIENPIFILALGPTATVLAYDLSLSGYQALDIGHLTNGYDSKIYGKPKAEELGYKKR